jgi:hypothetical protein
MYTVQELHKVFIPLLSKGYETRPHVYHEPFTPFTSEGTIIIGASGSTRKALIAYAAKRVKSPLVRKGLGLDKTFGETYVDLRVNLEGNSILLELLVVAPTKEHTTEEEFVPLGTFPIKGFFNNKIIKDLGLFDPAKIAKLTK